MSENLCALTFDDGPSRNTDELLDFLGSNGIRATFFLLGQNAQRNERLVRRMVEEGHEVGNHSWSHPNLRLLTTEEQVNQILETDALLRSYGAAPLYIRPPYGSYDDRTIRIVDEIGAAILLWSLDSHDWKKLPDNYAKLKSTRGTIYEDGALRGIFLFHDTHKSTVQDLPRILAQLRAGGCDRFVTVSEYLAGIGDPEPPLLMTRHAPAERQQVAAKTPMSGKTASHNIAPGSLKLARCSSPWQCGEEKQPDAPVEPGLDLEEAHAATMPTGGG